MISFIDQGVWIPYPTLTEKNLEDQTGKVFIVTGGYVGVGYELSKILYQRNGTVYVAGRSKEKAEKAISTLQKEVYDSSGRLEFLQLDLADLPTVPKSAADFMSRESRLDVLVNNAGVMTPPAGSKTSQGLELQLGTNCVGPYLFTKSLLPVLRETARASPPGSVRVTWAASIATEIYAPENGVTFESDGTPRIYDNQRMNYGASKVGNVFLAAEFARRYREDGIVSVAWNPGNLRTELQRHLNFLEKAAVNLICYPAVYGAYTELYAGWSKDISLKNTGSYVIPWGRIGKLRKDVELGLKRTDEGGTGHAERFWQWCEAEASRFA